MGIVRGIFSTNIKGKVGNVVYRTRGTTNVVSQMPAEVKNPRTEAQQRQRMVFNTVSQAYSMMKTICDHSFENITNGSACMAEFMRRNIELMKNQSSHFVLKGCPYMMPNPLIVAKGSLPSAPTTAFEISPQEGQTSAVFTLPLAVTTVETLNQTFGTKNGDQITFMAVGLKKDTSERYQFGTEIQRPTAFEYARIVFKQDATGSLTDQASESPTRGEFDTNLLDMEQSQFSGKIVLVGTKLGFSVNTIAEDDDVNLSCGAIIISRKENGKWLRSNSYLIMGSTSSAAEGGLDVNVLPSYNPSNAKYLNHATD